MAFRPHTIVRDGALSAAIPSGKMRPLEDVWPLYRISVPPGSESDEQLALGIGSPDRFVELDGMKRLRVLSRHEQDGEAVFELG